MPGPLDKAPNIDNVSGSKEPVGDSQHFDIHEELFGPPSTRRSPTPKEAQELTRPRTDKELLETEAALQGVIPGYKPVPLDTVRKLHGQTPMNKRTAELEARAIQEFPSKQDLGIEEINKIAAEAAREDLSKINHLPIDGE